MYKLPIILTLAVLIPLLLHISPQTKNHYEEWKQLHGFTFNSNEDSYRRNIFQQAVKEVEDFNQEGTQTYEIGINQFSHLTQEEWALIYLTKKTRGEVSVQVEDVVVPTAEDIDWTILGKVSGVKNQGACDAGYAFSTTGLIESYYRIAGGDVILSDQQLVDCSGAYETHGCNGGSRKGSMDFAKEQGLTTQAAYPYVGTVQACKLPTGTFKIKSYSNTTGCDAIGNALRKSPLSIAADASNWKPYRSGIFSNCGPNVTHDVLLVAQTTTSWKIKNSWGLSWGEYGYIRLALGNTCGICGITAFWVDL